MILNEKDIKRGVKMPSGYETYIGSPEGLTAKEKALTKSRAEVEMERDRNCLLGGANRELRLRRRCFPKDLGRR